MKKLSSLLCGIAITFASTYMLLSCGSTQRIAYYSVGLASVESPADAKQQFGETKVVTLNDNGISKYRYEDEFIEITWFVNSKQFSFTLKNKTAHTIRINWDDISYVDIYGKTGRVMHSGIKYNERNNSQPATAIPKGESLSDILLPTDNVYFVNSTKYVTGGWREKYLLPSVFTKETIKTLPEKIVGSKMSIMMPIVIENVQNDYTFLFNVDKVLNK